MFGALANALLEYIDNQLNVYITDKFRFENAFQQSNLRKERELNIEEVVWLLYLKIVIIPRNKYCWICSILTETSSYLNLY